MNKKQVVKFLLFVFITAYSIQIAVSLIALKNPMGLGNMFFGAGLMVVMFTPFFGTLFAKGNLKGIGFKPKFKKAAFLIPVCMFAPAIISIIGAALFFLVFPDYLDLSGSYLQSSLPEGVNLLDILEQNGLSYGIYVAISFVSSITYAPVINMFLAIGEEVGWRGFLYPELNKSMGKIPTWLLGGLIWGAFHFPVMILAGYEYGTTYWGFPVVGMLVFSLFTVALGLISEVIYDKTKCIWYPSLLHGAVNASNFVMLFFNINKENSDKMTILGPCFNGLVAGVPLLLTAVIVGMVSLKKKKEITEG
ncbi:MAG: CPBP family intramembrane metalloprotease [Lachnospiraceae bacterium]|nr:CPBP family intramembrane metalloprotease [Lachnospiraceae bacterium]